MEKLEKFQTGGYATNDYFIDVENDIELVGKIEARGIHINRDKLNDSIKQAVEQALAKDLSLLGENVK